MKVFVAQIGAREHYAVARALCQRGILAGMVTDWYAFGQSGNREAEIGGPNSGIKRAKAVIGGRWFGQIEASRLVQHLVRRSSAGVAHCRELSDDMVQAFPLRSLYWKWRVCRAKKSDRLYKAYAETNASFARALVPLKLPKHDVFFGYSYASLEILVAEKQRGVLSVLGQIDPGMVEFQLVAEEMARYPELAGPPSEFPGMYYERNQGWTYATHG